MNRTLAAYAATAVALLVIDMVWLGVIAKPLYQQGIGHLMAPQPRLWAAALFYLLYPGGLVLFAVLPNSRAEWPQTALMGAAFGLFAYATYDLTNLATLRDWPLGLSLIDTLWGAAVSAVASSAGRAALNHFTPAA